MQYPKAISQLIESFMRYPGIGLKTAERLALHTITKIKDEHIDIFAKSLINSKKDIHHCKICGVLTDQEKCSICLDKTRDKSKILIVEEAKDVFVLEKMSKYKGLYHVLNGALSPLNGIGPKELNIKSLLNRLKDDKIKELILGTNANVDGEATAMYICKILEKLQLDITKLAHGLPVGGDLEYADEVTLFRALEGRTKFN